MGLLRLGFRDEAEGLGLRGLTCGLELQLQAERRVCMEPAGIHQKINYVILVEKHHVFTP